MYENMFLFYEKKRKYNIFVTMAWNKKTLFLLMDVEVGRWINYEHYIQRL
jgi:hypothetical protein